MSRVSFVIGIGEEEKNKEELYLKGIFCFPLRERERSASTRKRILSYSFILCFTLSLNQSTVVLFYTKLKLYSFFLPFDVSTKCMVGRWWLFGIIPILSNEYFVCIRCIRTTLIETFHIFS